MSAIAMFWVRQLKRFRRSRVRILGSLGQPLLLLVALGYGLGPIYRKAGQGNYIQFLAPAVIGMAIMFGSIGFGFELIFDRQFGLLKASLVAPVSRLAIMIGRTAGGATVAVLQGLIVVGVCYAAGFRAGISSWALALVFMVMIAVLFTALGTAMALIVSDLQVYQLLQSFLVMPMFMLSGAIFPLNDVPRGLQMVASVDPFAYSVDGMRWALLGAKAAHFPVGTDVGVVCGASALLILVGGALFNRIQI